VPPISDEEPVRRVITTVSSDTNPLTVALAGKLGVNALPCVIGEGGLFRIAELKDDTSWDVLVMEDAIWTDHIPPLVAQGAGRIYWLKHRTQTQKGHGEQRKWLERSFCGWEIYVNPEFSHIPPELGRYLDPVCNLLACTRNASAYENALEVLDRVLLQNDTVDHAVELLYCLAALMWLRSPTVSSTAVEMLEKARACMSVLESRLKELAKERSWGRAMELLNAVAEGNAKCDFAGNDYRELKGALKMCFG